MICTYAHLDEEKLKAIKEVEKKIGKTLLAFSCRDMDVAPLSDEQMEELKRLEDKIGFPLVAV